MSLEPLVMKFGGTSVGSIERIQSLSHRLKIESQRRPLIIVVSAMAGETNRLIDLARSLNPMERGPAYDMLVSSGEQVSVALLSIALKQQGLKPKPLLGYQIGIRTDNVFSKARIQSIDTLKLKSYVEQGWTPVIAGFQGVDIEDQITTLGRGGSDTTAVALAAALGHKTCEIYTDVPAVCTADPRIVPKAREISRISFEEMMEMASLGSKVLHIRSVEIAAKYGVRIHLRSSFVEREGTWILPEGEVLEKAVVSAVTQDAQTAVVQLHPVPRGPQFMAHLFEKLAERGVGIDIITQSEIDDQSQRLAFSVTHEDLVMTQDVIASLFESKEFKAQQTAQQKKVQVEIIQGRAKISVVGVGMRHHPGVAARFFRVLAQHNIAVDLVTTSEIKISAVVLEKDMLKAAQALHSEFGLDA